ncbi:TlyA family RNA methyltransferase [Nesterenkonia populi]|uniref:TlyA family RNA methyltransferase n=1 Tax=Nesterenkonia populi TaxID=1591087 RepID=UPI0011BFD90A|nr:TlyA family RNA methyltransferase [Nesterenkonia populi]
MPRLDKEMVARGLAPSRTRAGQLIAEGAVRLNGRRAAKPSAAADAGATIELAETDRWVSRAAHKLLGALEAFPEAAPARRRCLDAGASTGGFTQVMLSRGAEHVVAVDVGHDQLAPALREDPRITNVEGTNLRYVRPGQLGDRFGLIVADLSFISLRLVLPALAQQAASGADLLLMVKPQFEVGRERIGRTGVVTSPQQRRDAVEGVVTAALEEGLQLAGAAPSPLPGQDGNREFFLHLRSPSAADAQELVSPADRLGAIDYADP